MLPGRDLRSRPSQPMWQLQGAGLFDISFPPIATHQRINDEERLTIFLRSLIFAQCFGGKSWLSFKPSAKTYIKIHFFSVFGQAPRTGAPIL